MTVQIASMIQRDIMPRGVPQLGEERDLALDLGDVIVWRVEVDHFEGHDGPSWVVDAFVNSYSFPLPFSWR
jgi:hypothetical protein